MNEMQQVLRFDDQDPKFSKGVEYGRIWGQMEQGVTPVSNRGFPVRVENREGYRELCDFMGYIPQFGKEWFGEWVEFYAIKKTTKDN